MLMKIRCMGNTTFFARKRQRAVGPNEHELVLEVVVIDSLPGVSDCF